MDLCDHHESRCDPRTDEGLIMSQTVGQEGPGVLLPRDGRQGWKLADAAGKNLVVYFYPEGQYHRAARWKARTSATCTPRSRRPEPTVLGVSHGQLSRRTRNSRPSRIPVRAARPTRTKKVCELFDVSGRRSRMYGRKFMGVERSTFLIDAEGVLRRSGARSRSPGHAAGSPRRGAGALTALPRGELPETRRGCCRPAEPCSNAACSCSTPTC